MSEPKAEAYEIQHNEYVLARLAELEARVEEILDSQKRLLAASKASSYALSTELENLLPEG